MSKFKIYKCLHALCIYQYIHFANVQHFQYHRVCKTILIFSSQRLCWKHLVLLFKDNLFIYCDQIQLQFTYSKIITTVAYINNQPIRV